MRTMTERERDIVMRLGHPVYTVKYLEEWLNREDNVVVNPVAALSIMGAKGFYAAVQAIDIQHLMH